MNSSAASNQIVILAAFVLLAGVVESMATEQFTGVVKPIAIQEPTHVDSVDKLARFTWTVLDTIEREHIQPPQREQLLRSVALLLTVPNKSKTPTVTTDGMVVTSTGRYMPSGIPEMTRVELPNQKPVVRQLQSCQNIDDFVEVFHTIWREFQQETAAGEAQCGELINYLRLKVSGLNLVSTKEEVINEQVRANRYIGIGVMLGPNSGQGISFSFIRPGGPADRAGLKAGTTVLEIGGESTRDMQSAAAIDRIRGPVGTEVALGIVDPGSSKAREIRIKRGFVRIDSLGDRNMPGSRPSLERVESMPIGLIKFNDISSSTVSELRDADASARSQGIRVMILDFRRHERSENLEQARLVADSLMDGGAIWSEVNRQSEVHRPVADRECLFREMLLVVLVSSDNHRSILTAVAAALQDAGRATIVGDRVDYGGRISTGTALPGFPYTLQLSTVQLVRAKQEARWPLVPDHLVAGSPAVNFQQIAARQGSTGEPSGSLQTLVGPAATLGWVPESDEPTSAIAPANVKFRRGLLDVASQHKWSAAEILKQKEVQEARRLYRESLQAAHESGDQIAIRVAKELLESRR